MPEWTTIHKVLPASFSGTTQRLQFTWQNTNSEPNNPPVAVDNIAVVARSTYIPEPNNIRELGVCNTSLRAWISNDILHIDGLTIGQIYRIYNIAGTLVHQGLATDTSTSLSVQNSIAERSRSGRNARILIIQSENKSVKIIY
jgi:hypothetical protein